MRARKARWLGAAAALCAYVVTANAQVPATPAPSAQQAFDSAQALIDGHKYAEAEAAFAALEARFAGRLNAPARSLAVARLRRAQMLIALDEGARATALLLQALPVFSAPADVDLRVEALLSLGEAEEYALDLAPAAEYYRTAMALIPKDHAREHVAMRMRVARTAMFDDPASVAADLASGLGEAQTALATDKPALAQYMTLYGRALLNAGQIKPARAAYNQALALSGGLTMKVHLGDLMLRGDAALAAELDHDHNAAARLISYTGAGQDPGISMRIPPDVDPPACGEDIRPDDMAVVQFSLGDDGHVAQAVPIYAARAGANAVLFARAVAGWEWKPEDAKAIKPFFRYAARLELRCTTRADRLSVDDLIKGEVAAWAVIHPKVEAARNLSVTGTQNEDHATTAARGNRGARTLRALDPAEQRTLLEDAVKDATDRGAPAIVRAWLLTKRNAIEIDRDRYAGKRRILREAAALATDAAFANEPRARAWLLLVAAEAASDNRHLAQANTLLGDVLAMPTAVLPTGDPIRSAAAVRRASVQTALGDRAAAVRTFSQSGVDPSQCALLDQTPVAVSRGASFTDYPQAALALGFEGWAVTEFDITADGRTKASRAVIVYPPFLFGQASAQIVSHSRYKPTFRPDGALSCGGYRDNVRFATGRGS